MTQKSHSYIYTLENLHKRPHIEMYKDVHLQHHYNRQLEAM